MDNNETLKNARELEFVIFCIESLASDLHKDSTDVYNALSGQHGIIRDYIVPEYDVLHTQGKGYILDDIKDVMRERGVNP